MKRVSGKTRLLVTSAILALALSESSLGQGRGNAGNDPGSRAFEQSAIQVNLDLESARHIVESYGLTGRKSLPPGIVRNIGRGKPLPPGLQLQRVPDIMLRELPVINGFEWNIAGEDLLLISVTTMLVEEVFREVFR
jgi:hypothetical protein